MNQYWVIVIETLGRKLRWNFIQNTNIFIHENAYENIVWETAVILSKGKWVKCVTIDLYLHSAAFPLRAADELCSIYHDDVIKWKHFPRYWSFVQGIRRSPFVQAQTKENIKAPRHWPLLGEFTGDRWMPRTNGQ